MSADAALALRLLRQLELPGLSDTALEDDMERLIQKAATPHGPVASICVWPSFISICASRLEGKSIKVATVINFPKGGDDVERAIADSEEAVRDGADEIDLVFPARTFVDGDVPIARSMIAEVKDAVPEDVLLKVILEASDFPDLESLQSACLLSIEEGADFLKTGTGRAAPASDAQLKAMLGVIRETGKTCGLVVVGKYASLQQARAGFDIAAGAIGDQWASADRFRISSASGLDALLSAINGAAK